MTRIGVNTDDDLPLNKQLKFPTLTIIIRCVFQEGKNLYPQIYLDKCLYELQKCCNTIEFIVIFYHYCCYYDCCNYCNYCDYYEYYNYRCVFWSISRDEAVNKLKNSVLENEDVL